MKIGIDAHNLEGQRTGVGRVLFNLFKQWNYFNLPNLEFILYFKKEIPDDLPRGKAGLRLKKPNFKKRILKAPFNLQSNALFRHYSLHNEATKDKLDILFCPDYVAPILYKGKTALILHDIIYQAHPELYNWPSFWDRILLKKFSKISAKKAKIIFTPSEFSRQEVIKYYKINPDKVSTILLAADDNFKPINDQKKLNEIKKKYQIKDKFILHIGSIFNRRHLPEAIKAFEKLSKKLPNYQFLIVGVNHTNPFINIDKLIKNKPIIHINYLQSRDLPLLYNAADLLVYLSDYEGFGLPVLESISCGTPVVAKPIASIPEVAGKAAIYIQDNSDINEIEKAIYKGLTNQELRSNLIEKGLEQAKKFSWEKCAQKYLDVLMNNGLK